jgi:hypothetical protein
MKQLLTIRLLEWKVTTLCLEYRTRLQSDQALYCWLQLSYTILILKLHIFLMYCYKFSGKIYHRNEAGLGLYGLMLTRALASCNYIITLFYIYVDCHLSIGMFILSIQMITDLIFVIFKESNCAVL